MEENRNNEEMVDPKDTVEEETKDSVSEEEVTVPKESYVYSWNGEKKASMPAKDGPEKSKRSPAVLILSVICGILAATVVVLSFSLILVPKGESGGAPEGFASSSVADIAALGEEFTVAIQTRVTSASGSVSMGTGTGIILTSNGYIATNSHVVSGAENITVYTRNGKTYGGKIIADDPSHDVALIRINPDDGESFKTATVADYSTVRVGDRVVAIGTPHSIDYAWTVSVGHVSNIGREMVITGGNKVTMMQIDVPVNPGNSGGPLINERGEVVGIVSAKLDEKYEGINFAIPISEYMDYFNGAIDADMSKPQLGVVGISVEGNSYYYIKDSSAVQVFNDGDGKGYYIVDSYYNSKYHLTEEESKSVYYVEKSGFLITAIGESSDANGKLQPFDVVTEFDGVELVYDENNDPYDTVIDILATKKASDVVEIKYLRGGKEGTVRISLREKE